MINIYPHHVAATLLFGGLTVGGYFTINVLIPPTLENHLESLNLKLVDSDWTQKAIDYKRADNNLIKTIDKNKENQEIESLLKKWCEKKKEKYFFGNEDETYRSFSVWCTITNTIKVVLEGRNLKTLNEEGWTKKFEKYSADTNTDKFITKPPTGVTKRNLEQWCQSEKENKYLYEGEENLDRILKWCYFN